MFEFESGDWVVHRDHGTGKVCGQAQLSLDGERKDYLKIQTHKAVIWLPQEKWNEEWLREPKSSDEFAEALEEFAATLKGYTPAPG